ncbi:MAG: hypothetical protein OXC95_04005 [Dehalococcoidia bacterium]|nr:hypothetical protein [Dehalococcoidia bacterium]
MGPLFLRLIFYMVTGVLLASISWSTISHSAVTGDYLLSFILLGMMFYVVGQFFVDRLRPEVAPHDFHDTLPWKTPHRTTMGGLWLRVGFNTLLNIAIYTALAFALILLTTARPAFMVLLGTLFVIRIPHLYWSMRGRYDSVTDSESAVLQYRGGSQTDRRTRWLLPIGMAGLGSAVAAIGMLLG